jgi:FkbM family methyltransferase
MQSWGSVAKRAVKSAVSRRRGDLLALNIVEHGNRLTALCPDDEVFTLSRELILDRIYERKGFSFVEGMGTVVDAGAHVGIFSLMASQWAHQVVSIEASRRNYGLLQLNIDRNGIKNIDARHRALWSRSGEMLSLEGMSNSGCGRVNDEFRSNAVGNAVESLSLDDLIDEVGPIDLLKIDIEGAEYKTFGACTKLSSISAIVGEMHLEDESERHLLDTLVRELETSGFRVDLVTEEELYSRESLSRLIKNRSSLRGRHLIKTLAAAYYLAPIEKPIGRGDATYELPILVAQRAG